MDLDKKTEGVILMLLKGNKEALNENRRTIKMLRTTIIVESVCWLLSIFLLR